MLRFQSLFPSWRKRILSSKSLGFQILTAWGIFLNNGIFDTCKNTCSIPSLSSRTGKYGTPPWKSVRIKRFSQHSDERGFMNLNAAGLKSYLQHSCRSCWDLGNVTSRVLASHPHPSHDSNNSTHIMGFLWGRNEMTNVNLLAQCLGWSRCTTKVSSYATNAIKPKTERMEQLFNTCSGYITNKEENNSSNITNEEHIMFQRK